MNKCKEAVSKFAAGPFFTLSRKPLEFVEKAKIFRFIFAFVCVVYAVITLIPPIFIFFRILTSGFFNFGIWHILGFLFVWAAIAAACWLGFHLWWSRRKKADEIFSREFFVLPFFAELTRTWGEWLGILFAVIGGAGGLFALIFFGRHAGGALEAILFGLGGGTTELGYLLYELEGILEAGIREVLRPFLTGAVILGPVAGILIVLATRFFAECLKVLAVIANNSRLLSTIAHNTKGKP